MRVALVVVMVAFVSVSGCSALTQGSDETSTITEAQAKATNPEAVALGFTFTDESRTDLRNYSAFTYQTAVSTGLNPDASVTANERIRGMVDSTVSDAIAADDNECAEGEERCGLFQHQLSTLKCSNGFLCIKQDIAYIPPGVMVSDPRTTVLVLDTVTGRVVPLSTVIADREVFVRAMNSVVADSQKKAGFFDANAPPNLSESDVATWAPLPDGIHLWFAKYSAGPGAMGVVEVVISPVDLEAASAPIAPVWVALEGKQSDPVYVLLKNYEEWDDGSVLLDIDPLSPDLATQDATSCMSVYFIRPDGSFCLTNSVKKVRQVTVLPDATFEVGDSETNFASVIEFIKTTDAVVRLRLNDDGYADYFHAYEAYRPVVPPKQQARPAAPSQSDAGQPPALPQPIAPAPAAPQSGTVPSVTGLDASAAQAILEQAGFRMSPGAPGFSRAYIKTQSPPAGSRMTLGSIVSVFFGY